MTRAVGGWNPFRVVLNWACRGLAGGFLLLRCFDVAVSVSPRVCFVLVLVSMFLGWCICELGVFHAGRAAGCLGAGAELGAGVCGPRAGWGPR